MADPYPSVPQRVGTEPVASFGTQVDRAESGKPRLRTFYSQAWTEFLVKHECSQAEMQSVMDHYLAWWSQPFVFTFQGDAANYTVRWAEIPKTQVLDGDYLWAVEARLIVV